MTDPRLETVLDLAEAQIRRLARESEYAHGTILAEQSKAMAELVHAVGFCLSGNHGCVNSTSPLSPDRNTDDLLDLSKYRCASANHDTDSAVQETAQATTPQSDAAPSERHEAQPLRPLVPKESDDPRPEPAVLQGD